MQDEELSQQNSWLRTELQDMPDKVGTPSSLGILNCIDKCRLCAVLSFELLINVGLKTAGGVNAFSRLSTVVVRSFRNVKVFVKE